MIFTDLYKPETTAKYDFLYDPEISVINRIALLYPLTPGDVIPLTDQLNALLEDASRELFELHAKMDKMVGALK